MADGDDEDAADEHDEVNGMAIKSTTYFNIILRLLINDKALTSITKRHLAALTAKAAVEKNLSQAQSRSQKLNIRKDKIYAGKAAHMFGLASDCCATVLVFDISKTSKNKAKEVLVKLCDKWEEAEPGERIKLTEAMESLDQDIRNIVKEKGKDKKKLSKKRQEQLDKSIKAAELAISSRFSSN